MKDSIVKRSLLCTWNWIYDARGYTNDVIHLLRDWTYCMLHKSPHVSSIQKTIDLIVEKRLSVCRFGDGEIKLIAGKNLLFQQCTPNLQAKLVMVLSSSEEGILICLPDVFENRSEYVPSAQQHWNKHLSYFREQWYRHIDCNSQYGNAFLSRCYLELADKTPCQHYFDSLKQIWNDRDVLLIEGEKSRLGVGNDLFDNTKSIKRILGPNREGFDYYDAIINEAKRYPTSVYLVLLALGPTATVMAYDLAKAGYQAVDIGHVDIEYEWFRMGATHKVPVPSKFVNEAGAGAGVGDIGDVKYKSEIVWHY